MQQTSDDGTRSKDRRDARKFSTSLLNVVRSKRICALLTPDELDWMHLLKDRMQEIGYDRDWVDDE